MTLPSEQSSLIAVRGLVKAFGIRPVLRDLNFDIRSGSVVALLGANGSGKTTLLRMLSGLSKQTAGTIMVGGWALPSEAAAVRAQIGVVAHLPLLYDDLTAEENLKFFARLYRTDLARVAVVLERVSLAKRAKEIVSTFSRGMQQRLAIARAMLHNPAVMLLDEPYTGLDVHGAELLDELIREWHTAGRTLILSLHDLDRAASISDHLLLLNKGKIALDSPSSDVQNLPAKFAELTAP